MPLTEKGQKILSEMKDQYGEEKGEQVFYASKNAGKIKGVDNFARNLAALDQIRSALTAPRQAGDQTGGDFLGMLRNIAQGFLDWTAEEGEEAEHPGAPGLAQVAPTLLDETPPNAIEHPPNGGAPPGWLDRRQPPPHSSGVADCGPEMSHDDGPISNGYLPQRHASLDWGSPRQPPAPNNHSLGTNGHGSWQPRQPGDNAGPPNAGWASPRQPVAPDWGQRQTGYDDDFPGTGPSTVPRSPPNGGMRLGPSGGAPMQIIFSPEALVGGLKFSTGSLLEQQAKQAQTMSRAIDRRVPRTSRDVGATKIGAEPIRTPPLKPPDATADPLRPSRSADAIPGTMPPQRPVPQPGIPKPPQVNPGAEPGTNHPGLRIPGNVPGPLPQPSQWRSPAQPPDSARTQHDARNARRASLLRHRGDAAIDAGTSEGAKKAAATRAAHGGSSQTPAQQHNAAHAFHKEQGLAGKSGHGQAAALHQHARMMHESPNPMMRSKAPAASQKAWAASAAVGHHPHD